MAERLIEPPLGPGAFTNTCTCGHPEREHSACNGECYQCGCKRYAPVCMRDQTKSSPLMRIVRGWFVRQRSKSAG